MAKLDRRRLFLGAKLKSRYNQFNLFTNSEYIAIMINKKAVKPSPRRKTKDIDFLLANRQIILKIIHRIFV